ncbi:PREDICTED: ubiquitin-conjugating enzyme E2 H [Sturnus vulgaris]|uniref:ubiquitin-conjugating enzyme E2 H n=1 Tax=Sturnus vulgaris TaxID=9172 RepID=UPI000719EF0D|nr:PREDICTED: ubiquitin-conjugating enzyme E2 H [Sturnus vulgaris]
MSSPSPGKRRMDTDVVKLIESKHEVTILGGLNEFVVKFYGPQGSKFGTFPEKKKTHDKKYIYLGGFFWFFFSADFSLCVLAGFMNKIFHPNIDEASGTVCLDVINQTWTALYDLTNIFESFLPQLLAYPNPIDPLNGDAAAMYLHRPEEYKQKIKGSPKPLRAEPPPCLTPLPAPPILPGVPQTSAVGAVSHPGGAMRVTTKSRCSPSARSRGCPPALGGLFGVPGVPPSPPGSDPWPLCSPDGSSAVTE